MTLVAVDQPALGAFLNLPDLEEAKDRARWSYRISRLDYAARTDAIRRLSRIYDGLRTGRRLDLIADDLTALAARLEDVPQPLVGGWAIYPWLIGDPS